MGSNCMGTISPKLLRRQYVAAPGKLGSHGLMAEKDPRSDFDRDYARVVHSGAFRRLQGKSQVVHAGHADFFRTRLTHTLEVSQIGEALAGMLAPRDLGLRALVRVACLVHDLGHPPFGHNGEDALKAWADDHGSSFEANAQSFRIVTSLEVKYPPSMTGGESVGLNLTLGSLIASTKYPWAQDATDAYRKRKFGFYEEDLSHAEDILDYLRAPSGAIRKHAAGAIMDWSDDVAYSVHDLEDGLRARLIPLHYLRSPDGAGKRREIASLARDAYDPPFSLSDLEVIFDDLLNSEYFAWCVGPYVHDDEQRGHHKMMTSALIDKFVRGLQRAAPHGPLAWDDDVERTPICEAEIALLKAMHWHYVVSSRELQTMQYRERRVITDLANAMFVDGDLLLPPEHRDSYRDALVEDLKWFGGSESDWKDMVRLGETKFGPGIARIVADYVSGMTDRFADRLHARILGAGPGTISDLI